MIGRALLALSLAFAGVSGALAQMAETGDAQQQAYVDEHYPFVEQGAEPPGRTVPLERGTGSRWSGKSGWRTRNGPTVVWWSFGKPNRVEAARYPDGSRGLAQYVLEHGWRRRASDGRRWIHGAIEVQPNDVIFTDGQQPVYVPPAQTDVPNLEADLARDAAFLAAIEDDRFAKAVYTTFRNRTFYKGADERSWVCGDRAAAGLVAHLRGLGESYLDWFLRDGLNGVYPDDRQEREGLLRSNLDLFSRQFSIERMIPSWLGPDQSAELRRQLEARRPELEEQLKATETQRAKVVQDTQQALANLDQNADVFHAVRDHLTRLGWRSETAEDRARAERARLTQAVALLQELKTLGQRPEALPGAWADKLRPPPRPAISDEEQARKVAEKVRELARRQPQGGGNIVVQVPSGAVSQTSAANLSEDEREVRSGGLRRRLTGLAVSGRISKDEYDGLLQRFGRLRF